MLDKPSAKALVSCFSALLLFLASKPSSRNMLSIHFNGQNMLEQVGGRLPIKTGAESL
jgi:hypothetical protein